MRDYLAEVERFIVAHKNYWQMDVIETTPEGLGATTKDDTLLDLTHADMDAVCKELREARRKAAAFDAMVENGFRVTHENVKGVPVWHCSNAMSKFGFGPTAVDAVESALARTQE